MRILLYILFVVLAQGVRLFGLSSAYERKLNEYFPSGKTKEFAYAASRGVEKRVKEFLASGYSIDQVGEGGMTPLILSAMLGNRKQLSYYCKTEQTLISKVMKEVPL